jgi:formate-dependent nitrite reductase membrane component NrfD
MADGIFWGLPVILYLFLAGMGAGATTVSASMLLRGGGGARGEHHEIARYGAILGPWPVMIGTALIILELGSIEVATTFAS